MSPAVHPTHARLHLGLMLALTFSTGIVDAVGYLGLDRVFTGNMTGNVVILGMALVGGDGLPIVGPVIALATFMLGAATAGRVLRPVKSGWPLRSTVVLAIVGLLLATIATAAWAFADMGEPLRLSITGALGAAMGMQAATARQIAVADVTTVVVTSTITGLAADSWFGRRVSHPWPRRVAAVALILAGAAAGALALKIHIALGISISALITLIVAVWGLFTRAEAQVKTNATVQMAAANEVR